ncbi:MAG: hypothetical protein IPO21_00365 [Bacteroidales bacterium]|nr:hypothetical protein [Bacteroidales bacterium]
MKAEKDGSRGYSVMEVTQFNIQYWKGNVDTGNYVIQINFTTAPFYFKITTPGDGNLFKQGDEVNIAAESTSSSIAKVEFYCNANLISTDYSAPYEAVWSSDTATNGYAMIKALAFDNQGNTAFSQREINIIVNEDKPSPLIQKVAIQKGWNLISINLQPTDSSVESLFWNIDIEVIKSSDGYWRKGQYTIFNSLQYLSAGEGYVLKSNITDTLIVSGVIRQTGNVTSSNNGWRLLGVSYQNKTSIARDYNQTNTSIIKNFDGFWIPGETTNSIKYFEPGKAYFWKP